MAIDSSKRFTLQYLKGFLLLLLLVPACYGAASIDFYDLEGFGLKRLVSIASLFAILALTLLVVVAPWWDREGTIGIQTYTRVFLVAALLWLVWIDFWGSSVRTRGWGEEFLDAMGAGLFLFTLIATLTAMGLICREVAASRYRMAGVWGTVALAFWTASGVQVAFLSASHCAT